MPMAVPAVQGRAPRKIAQGGVASFPLLERAAKALWSMAAMSTTMTHIGKLVPNAALSGVVRLRQQQYAGKELVQSAAREVS